jgi:23S rRNA pseudouridine1911/1915/1917 synthase
MEIKFRTQKSYKSLNSFLTAEHFSKSLISFYKKNNHMISVNNETKDTTIPVAKGDVILVKLPNEGNDIPLIDKPLEIVYEDRFLLIINKPANLATTPTRAHYDNNLSGMIVNHFKDIKLKSKVHLVNRLDKETRGLLIVAKHQYIHALLSSIKIDKKYRAKLDGILKPTSGIIEKRIAKLESSMERVEKADGDISITKYNVKKYKDNKTYVEAELITGRTHQLRLHFKLLGHPIIGDPLYGQVGNFLYLQSFYLKFKHPIINRTISIKLKKEWD